MEKDWSELDEKGYLSSLLVIDRKDDRPLDFHGAFVPQVAEALILRHTDPGEWVWDCFAGSGTTGIVAEQLGRNCFMTDLNPRPPVRHKANARTVTVQCSSHKPTAFDLADCYTRRIAKDITQSCPLFEFDLVIMHPPYHSIIKFSDDPRDLGNCPSIGRFLTMWEETCRNVARHVRPGGYLGLVIGDIWLTKEQIKSESIIHSSGVFPLGFECMSIAKDVLGTNAQLTSIVVKNIAGNRHNANRRNLMLSRMEKWGSVLFCHEYVFSIRRGK